MLKLSDDAIAKHLIVISYDAFSEDNWKKASALPNLSRLIQNGAYSNRLQSVYPTLTYVVHTTMVTGCYPDKHGIIHNNQFQPFVVEKDRSWYWFRSDVKVPAVYDKLKEYHMSAAGLLWPVTGKAAICYNIPEIRAIKDENQAIKALKNGSPFYSLNMEMKFGKFRKGIEQPYLDDFTTRCAVDTIKRKKPNLFLMHMIDLDDAKHAFGTDSIEVEQVIIRMDLRLGSIMKAVDDAGMTDDTVFMVIGDHGQINVRYRVQLNCLLKENGLIYEENGTMQWRAYVQGAGGAAYLYIKPGDLEAEKSARKILETALKEECYGIERLYSQEEQEQLRIKTPACYMIEAKTGYYFEDGLDEPVVVDYEKQGKKYATHGYSPDKPDYKCNLIISGSKTKKGYNLGDVEMVDIAPTIAQILGIEFNECDGKPIDKIFNV